MKQFSIVLIILMLIAFISTTFYTKNTVKVSEVVTPALVSLDLNKNGRTEANERFVVEAIDTLYARFKHEFECAEQEMSLKFAEFKEFKEEDHPMSA